MKFLLVSAMVVFTLFGFVIGHLAYNRNFSASTYRDNNQTLIIDSNTVTNDTGKFNFDKQNSIDLILEYAIKNNISQIHQLIKNW